MHTNLTETSNRLCRGCNTIYPITEYSPSKQRASDWRCKKCASLRIKKYLHRHPDMANRCRHTPAAKQARKAFNDKRRVWCTRYLNYLKSRPCMDCGELLNPWQMDFDHRPGVEKKFNLSRKPTSKTQVLAEVAKCDVVCSNCHRNRTYLRAHPEFIPRAL